MGMFIDLLSNIGMNDCSLVCKLIVQHGMYDSSRFTGVGISGSSIFHTHLQPFTQSAPRTGYQEQSATHVGPRKVLGKLGTGGTLAPHPLT